MSADALADMAVEVTATFDAPIDEVWALLSDVERMAGLGPEHYRAAWDTSGPAAGARFTGWNRNGDFEWDVRCVVTGCRPPQFLEWTVGTAPEHSSTWSYTLSEGPGDRSSGGSGATTIVVQRFRHGPGVSYVRMRVDRRPEDVEAIMAGRCAMLRAGMEQTLAAARRVLDGGGVPTG